ncbi:Translation elongation factor P Lys34:lysine transferase [uncultured Candidatus Thioglobus sp.]|nr:Translation elongation factor P Lys34:lysine transferase [uncultured Candidatus Thioglobus sp.]
MQKSLVNTLKIQAEFIKKIRQFFDHQGVIEVQTPHLLDYPVTDIYIDSIAMQVNKDIGVKSKYLHTSPELEMKKLLVRGSGDIYQICQVFRDNEQGLQNFNEFTMLEYYRLGFDIHQLMDDIAALLKNLGITHSVTKLSYAQAFSDYADIDILNTDFNALKNIAKTHGLTTDFDWIEELQILMFTHLIEPKLAEIPLCFIYHYPKQQAALARVERQVAHRFELYINGVEIANGYDELQNGVAYQAVFLEEINKRQQLSKFTPDINQQFLSELNNPLPQCSGVAIGIDRLLKYSL